MFQMYGDLRGVTRHPGAHQAHLASFSVEFYSIQVRVNDAVPVILLCVLFCGPGGGGQDIGEGGGGGGVVVSFVQFGFGNAQQCDKAVVVC